MALAMTITEPQRTGGQNAGWCLLKPLSYFTVKICSEAPCAPDMEPMILNGQLQCLRPNLKHTFLSRASSQSGPEGVLGYSSAPQDFAPFIPLGAKAWAPKDVITVGSLWVSPIPHGSCSQSLTTSTGRRIPTSWGEQHPEITQ